LSHHVHIIIVQKYFILKSILKILFYFVFSKYFLGVFCTSLTEADSMLLNIGLSSAWKKATVRGKVAIHCGHGDAYEERQNLFVKKYNTI